MEAQKNKEKTEDLETTVLKFPTRHLNCKPVEIKEADGKTYIYAGEVFGIKAEFNKEKYEESWLPFGFVFGSYKLTKYEKIEPKKVLGIPIQPKKKKVWSIKSIYQDEMIICCGGDKEVTVLDTPQKRLYLFNKQNCMVPAIIYAARLGLPNTARWWRTGKDITPELTEDIIDRVFKPIEQRIYESYKKTYLG